MMLNDSISNKDIAVKLIQFYSHNGYCIFYGSLFKRKEFCMINSGTDVSLSFQIRSRDDEGRRHRSAGMIRCLNYIGIVVY